MIYRSFEERRSIRVCSQVYTRPQTEFSCNESIGIDVSPAPPQMCAANFSFRARTYTGRNVKVAAINARSSHFSHHCPALGLHIPVVVTRTSQFIMPQMTMDVETLYIFALDFLRDDHDLLKQWIVLTQIFVRNEESSSRKVN